MKDSQTKQVEQPAKNEPTPVKGDADLRTELIEFLKWYNGYSENLLLTEKSVDDWFYTRKRMQDDKIPPYHEPKAAPKGDDVISKEDATVCVFCDAVCERSPTKRGWASVGKYKKGLHFDCAKKVASLDKSAPQAVKWVQASERLPEKDGIYFVKLENGGVDCPTYTVKNGFKKMSPFEGEVVQWLDDLNAVADISREYREYR